MMQLLTAMILAEDAQVRVIVLYPLEVLVACVHGIRVTLLIAAAQAVELTAAIGHLHGLDRPQTSALVFAHMSAPLKAKPPVLKFFEHVMQP